MPALAENLVTNGHFSDGYTGFSSSYTVGSKDIPEGTYLIVAKGVDAHSAWPSCDERKCYDHTSGDENGRFLAANASDDTTLAVWKTVTAIRVREAGTPYRFEAYITKLYAENPASLKFQLGDGTTWADLGTTASLASAGTPEWVFTYTDGKFDQAGNYYIRLLNNNSVAAGNDFGLDDIYFGLRSTSPSKDTVPGVPAEDVPSYDTEDMNRAPEVTAGGTTSFTGVAVAVASSITVNDPDGDDEWNGGSVKVQITQNSEAEDTLYLPISDPGGGAIWIDTLAVKTGDTTTIGTASSASVTNNTAWTITFNSNATNALVQSTARAIMFKNENGSRGTSARTVTFTATDKHDSDTDDTQTISMDAATTSQVSLTGPATATAGAVSTVFTLTSQNGNGDTANVTSDTVFSLSSNSSGTATFYSDAGGTSVIPEVTISNGSSSATFYYKDTKAGSPTVTATRTSGMSLGSDTHGLTVNAGTASKIRVETAADGSGSVVSSQDVTQGSSITVYAISRDAQDNFVANVTDGNWSLENKTSGVADGDLVGGGGSAVFTGHMIGTANIRVTKDGLVSTDSDTITVVAGTASQVNLTGPASATAGTVSTAFTLTSQDASGNASNVTAATTFDLSSNSSGTKVFYSDAAGTAVITQVTIANGSSTATFYYKDSDTGTPTLTAAWNSGGTNLGSDTLQITVSLATTTLATTTPTSYDCSVTRVEMHNGTSWITIFSGTAPLDVVPGGTFLGVADLSLPAGTYSQIRVTFTNSFPVKGSRRYGVATYYTTATTFGGQTNLASTPATGAGSLAEFTFRIEAWGAINDEVTQTFSITPVTVDPLTDYQPTLRFTISDKLLLKGTAGTPSTYYFALSAPTVSIVEP